MQARLGGTQRVVGLRHLSVKQHQNVFVVALGGEPGCIGRLDGAAEAPPEIQLPADVETRAVLPQMAVLRVVAAPLATLEVDAVGADLLELRVAVA
ncbi:hypothetical protein D3C81_1718660 [compost metagenome]